MVCTGSWRSVQADGTGSKSIESSAAPGVVLESARPSSVGGKKPEGDTLGVRFFTAFCNHWQFLLGFSAMAKQNQNPKTRKTRSQKNNKKNTMTRPNSLPLLPPLGCAIFFFVSWFFGFLFSGSLLVFLKWPNKTKIQKNKKPKKQQKKHNDQTQLSATTPTLGVCNLVFFCFLFFWFLVSFFLCSGSLLVFWRAQDLDLFAGSPTLWVANLLLVDFIICFGPVVPLENNVKNYGKMQVSLEEAWGAWDTN